MGGYDPDKALAALIDAANEGNANGVATLASVLIDLHDAGEYLPRWPQTPIGDRMPPRVAWQLGRVVAALDAAGGSTPWRGAKRAYARALLGVRADAEGAPGEGAS